MPGARAKNLRLGDRSDGGEARLFRRNADLKVGSSTKPEG